MLEKFTGSSCTTRIVNDRDSHTARVLVPPTIVLQKHSSLEPLKHVVEGGHVHDRLSVVAGIESVVHERRERVAGVEVHAARVRGYGSVRGQSVHAGAVVRVGAGVAGAAHAAAHVAGVHLLGGGGVVEAEPRHAAPALLLDVVAAPLRAGVLEPHLVGKKKGG